jgi:hypothetical protein
MHMHVARRDQRQTAGRAKACNFQPGGIIRPGVQFDGNPRPTGKTLGQPEPICHRNGFSPAPTTPGNRAAHRSAKRLQIDYAAST